MDIKGKAKLFFHTHMRKRLLKALLIICSLLVIYGITSTAMRYALGRYSCWSAWHESGMDHKYSLRSGCKIQKGDNWVPAKNFRLE